MRKISVIFICMYLINCQAVHIEESPYDLKFDNLAVTWDEGMPLGNAIIGSLVWQKGDHLRMSLDHVELWDERPMVNRDSLPTRNFRWVQQQVEKKQYRPVQLMYDVPYDTSAYPTKIPGGGLEFATLPLGKAQHVQLYMNNALCEVKWPGGTSMQSFVHASESVGWFRFENIMEDIVPILVAPAYQAISDGVTNPVEGQDLRRLGYKQGTIEQDGTLSFYTQRGSNGFEYQIAVQYKKQGNTIEGAWSISHNNMKKGELTAIEQVKSAMQRGFASDYKIHNEWWTQFWKKSSISIPDQVLAKQYHNEMYKFGSTSREYSPPISLQSVWTADNGKLPPWKGDYHHDLNTQLSYWPAYTGNHLDKSMGYLNWLWSVLPANKRYTKSYFGVEGLAVPGVSTLAGEPMAGWIQYSFSPTTAAWLSQHFYMQWKYSQDLEFLKNRAYPYIKDVAIFLDQLSIRDSDNKRKLPISSSPEIYDNSIKAWFQTTTNYDLGLIRFVYTVAGELATELGLKEEAGKWKIILSEWTDFDLDEEGALTFAKGFPYNESHRHFSNIMAFHPLGLIDWSNGEKDRKIIRATIDKLEKYGPDYWCGYSYSWLGNAMARAMDGEGAAKVLKIFAEHFCLRNTFHANGDQTKKGFSKFTYRPFTLEGNMAFASGVQEMLMQSHTGVVRVFPAIPASWKNASFDQFRSTGAFLVSSSMKEGKVEFVSLVSEKGKDFELENPWKNEKVQVFRNGKKAEVLNQDIMIVKTAVNEEIKLEVL